MSPSPTRPVHELTTDQAVEELERVCDQLLDRPSPALTARKTELEDWILMHQPKEPTPMPQKRLTEEEKRAKNREYNRKWAQKKAAEKRAAKGGPVSAPKASPRPVPPQVAPPQQIKKDAAVADTILEVSIPQGLSLLMEGVLKVMQAVMRMDSEERADLVLPAANLDALAHQLAQFLATGRIEVAA